jgi:hypothetical protein
MPQRIRATYRDGAFYPETPCEFPEDSQVELLVQFPLASDPSVTETNERLRILKRVTERMRSNPLPRNSTAFSRDELHTRR